MTSKITELYLERIDRINKSELYRLCIGYNKCRKKENKKNKFSVLKELVISNIILNWPSSLKTNESVWTLSQNLYVSQHTRTGTLLDRAISAMRELPTRDITKPFASKPFAPRNTFVACKQNINIKKYKFLIIKSSAEWSVAFCKWYCDCAYQYILQTYTNTLHDINVY